MNADQVLQAIATNIVNPAIALIFAWAMVLFLWGIFEFIFHAEVDAAREAGKNHMLYGVLGITIIVSVYGLLHLIQNFFVNG